MNNKNFNLKHSSLNNLPPSKQQVNHHNKNRCSKSDRKSKPLTIVHWNCNSIKGQKLEEFKEYLISSKPDIVSLNEIKCNRYQANDLLLNIPDYSVVLKTRNNFGGGVALFIKKTFDFEELLIPDTLEEEIIGIKLSAKNYNSHQIGDLVLFSYYNPPNKTINQDMVSKIFNSNKNFILMGDLNAKNKFMGSSTTNKNGEILENIISSSRAQILNNQFEPTFHIYKENDEYHACLDFFIGSASVAAKLINCQTLQNEFLCSDHSPIELIIGSCIVNSNKEEISSKTIYNFEKANWDSFKEIITDTIVSIDDGYINSLNRDQLNELIIDSIKRAMEKSIPKVKRNLNKNKLNLPVEIVKTIKLRNKWQKKFRRNKIAELKEIVNSLNKIIKSEIRAFKESKWINFLLNLGKNPVTTVPFWNRINLVRNGRKSNGIGHLSVNGVTITDDKTKVELFSDKLSKTFNHDPNDSFKFNDAHKAKVENNILNYLKDQNSANEPVLNGFLTVNNRTKVNFKNNDMLVIYNLKLIHLGEVKKAVKSINNKPTLDQDGISNKIIRKLPDRLLMLLVKLFNNCLMENSYCSNWKNATVTMIPKKGDKTNINNYRPISSTPCLMKLFERIIAIRLKKFLHKNNILVKYQSGFRNDRQTKDNLVFLTQKSLEHMKRKRKAICILFDIKQAFDKIWHDGLINKLIEIKLPKYLILWIMGFLENRTFIVKIKEVSSNKLNIGCGVPQGAVLSPILFGIYINDLPQNNRRNNRYSFLFADDLAYLHLVKNVSKRVEAAINKHLGVIEKWLADWRLSMSPEKCNFIIFSNKPNNRETLNLAIHGKKIEKSNNPIFLGITLDPSMTFNNNFDNIRKRCLDRLNVLKVLAHKSWGLSTKTLVQVYNTLIRSLLEYSMFTYPLLNKVNRKKMQAIQNNALRIIFKKKKDESVEQLHTDLGLPNIQERAKNLVKTYLDKALNKENPMIVELIEDYDHFKNYNSNIKKQTIFDFFID